MLKKLNEDNMKEKEAQAKNRERVKQNLLKLKSQIEEKKQNMDTDYLTKTEALQNHFATVRVDFEKPTKDIISGLPGISRTYERDKQLKIIEKSSLNQDKMDKILYKDKYKKPRKLRYPLNQQKENKEGDKSFNKKSFRTEYQLIKYKNNMNPYNIISNTFRRNRLED